MLRPRDGVFVTEAVPALSALNMRLRDDYVADAAAGVNRWNRVFARTGIDFRITLPHVAFNRRIGELPRSTPTPRPRDVREEWERRRKHAPSTEDNLFIASLMRPVAGTRGVRLLDRAAAAWDR